MVKRSDAAISSQARALGERLKRQRERRGISLQSISLSTKIPVSLYAGLERGDCSRWPAGLYGRAYVRGYADAIGANADEIVEDFTAAFGGTIQDDGTPAPPPRVPRAGSLRLGMVDEPSIKPQHLARRLGLAAADLTIGFVLAWIAHVGLDASVWVTVGTALAYYAVGRAVSDDPLLYWLFQRARHAIMPVPQEIPSADVTVHDTASTAA